MALENNGQEGGDTRWYITLKAPADTGEAKLSREDRVELREGSAWREWQARASATGIKVKGAKGKEEL